MSDTTSRIAFYRTRSATDVINVTFRLFRDQFVSLAKGLLLLAGVPLIVANGLNSFISLGEVPMPYVLGLLGVQAILGTIGAIIVAAVTMGGLQIYRRDGPERIPVGRLWDMVYEHGLALFGRQIQVGFIIGVGAFLAMFPGLLIAEGIGSENPITAVFSGGLIACPLLAWLLYAGPRLALLFPGQVDPERSISVTRCRELVWGHWGQTTGVLLLAVVIGIIVFSVGWIPKFVLQALKGMGVSYVETVGPIVAGVCSGTARAFSSAILYIALTLQYYNLVERHEQVSLAGEVEQMEEHASSDGEGGALREKSAIGKPEGTSDSNSSSRWQDDSSDTPTR